MQPKPIVPPRLAAGARVALLAPSGPVPELAGIAGALENCRTLGLEPVVMPHASSRWGYLAGSDDERLGDLNAALSDPTIDAIWCLRGGSGLNRIVHRLDFDRFARRPKVVLGYSDITVLLHALRAKTGVATFHGPVARTPLTRFSQSALDQVAFHRIAAGPLAIDLDEAVVTITPGVAQGRLLGGNLSLLQALIGTDYFPNLDGAILFLEDVNEAVYRIDRTLAHFRLIGALDRLAGVVIGRVTEIPPHPGDNAIGLDRLWQHYFGPLGVPVASGFPIGHIDSQWTLPLGVMAELDATNGRLSLLDAAVK